MLLDSSLELELTDTEPSIILDEDVTVELRDSPSMIDELDNSVSSLSPLLRLLLLLVNDGKVGSTDPPDENV